MTKSPTSSVKPEGGKTSIKEKFGVLLVHGIGSPKKGETLKDWGNALLNALKEKESEALEVKFGPTVLSIEGRPAHMNVKLTYNVVGTDGGKLTGECNMIIAEGWWAKSFQEPSFWSFLKWSFLAIPWTVVSHFDERFRRAGNDVENSWRKQEPWLAGLYCWNTLLEALGLFVGLLLTPLILVLLVILVVLRVTQIPTLKDWAAQMQSMLTATAGDIFVFLDNTVIKQAIITEVRNVLTWLLHETGEVAIVAHSQGAAVSHQILKEQLAKKNAPGSIPLFITFGAGLKKLKELERLKKGGSIRYVVALFWAVGSMVAATIAAYLMYVKVYEAEDLTIGIILELTAFPFAIGLIALLLRTLAYQCHQGHLKNSPPPSPVDVQNKSVKNALSRKYNWGFWIFILFVGFISYMIGPIKGDAVILSITGLLGLAFTLLMEWRMAILRSTSSKDQKSDEENYWKNDIKIGSGKWHDYYARLDPVPNGPLFDEFTDSSLTSNQIMNYESLVGDHTSYWGNKDEFVSPVVNSLLEVIGLRDKEATVRKSGFYSNSTSDVIWKTIAVLVIIAVALLLSLYGFTETTIKKCLMYLLISSDNQGIQVNAMNETISAGNYVWNLIKDFTGLIFIAVYGGILYLANRLVWRVRTFV